MGTEADDRVAAAALKLAGFNISPTLVPLVPDVGESGNVRAMVGPAVTADRLFLYFTRSSIVEPTTAPQGSKGEPQDAFTQVRALGGRVLTSIDRRSYTSALFCKGDSLLFGAN